jgi:Putative zinc-finger
VNKSESNTLRQELARSSQAGPHPDADLLSAFAEGALLDRERQQVLAHLASCAGCRQVLSIAVQAAPEPAAELTPHPAPLPAHRPLQPWLIWAATAAVILLAGSIGFLYQQRLALQRRSTVAINSTSIAAPAVQPSQAQPELAQTSPAPPPHSERKKTAAPPAGKPAETPPPPQSLIAAAGMVRTGSNEMRLQSNAPQQSNGPLATPSNRTVTPSVMETQKVEVTPMVSAPRAAPAQSVSGFAGFGRENALAKASDKSLDRPQWRINSLGQPERSIGNGPWQPVSLNDRTKMRVVAVIGAEVWVGGENMRLYLSRDSGATWTSIVLPEKDGPSHAITQIRFANSQSGTVEAEDGTIWTTTDGGSTWK